MDRATIGALSVWDPAIRGYVTLEPGVRLRGCRVLRAASPELLPAYSAEFEVNGRTCRCPLYRFQSRTKVID